jgi:hypothetical protein
VSKPKRGGVQHRGRVTVRTGQPRPSRRDKLLAGAAESASTAIAEARAPIWQNRLQGLVDYSPEAAEAMRRLGAQLEAAEAPDRGATTEQATCRHPQASSADELPYSDPAKVWRCDSCQLLHRWTDGQMVPA